MILAEIIHATSLSGPIRSKPITTRDWLPPVFPRFVPTARIWIYFKILLVIWSYSYMTSRRPYWCSKTIVSLRNRTVERRGRQNAWAWQTWRDYYLRVLSRIHLKLMFLTLLQKDLFKGMWSLAEAKQKQNYCHACHTRFAVVFPLPSCCVSSLMKRPPCWCTKSILGELNYFLARTLSFVPINLHTYWPCEWKGSILTSDTTKGLVYLKAKS